MADVKEIDKLLELSEYDFSFEEFVSEFSLEIDYFQKLPQRAKEYVLWRDYTHHGYLNNIIHIIGFDINCESPIEILMYLALQEFVFEAIPFMDIYLAPQHKIQTKNKNYRVDFLLSEKASHDYCNEFDVSKHYGLVIECDGHEFHEKTKEQVKNNNQRDIDIKMKGYGILHFSGSQIYKDPFKCATEIFHYYCKKLEEHHGRNNG